MIKQLYWILKLKSKGHSVLRPPMAIQILLD